MSQFVEALQVIAILSSDEFKIFIILFGVNFCILYSKEDLSGVNNVKNLKDYLDILAIRQLFQEDVPE